MIEGVPVLRGRPIPEGPASVAQVLEGPLRRHPDAEALVGRHARYSYAELEREVQRAAAALQAVGVRAGDRVAVCMRNDPEIVIAFLAVMRLGALWVGMNLVLAPSEKAFLVADAGVSLLLAEPAVLEELAPHRAELPSLLEALDVVPGDPWSGWRRVMATSGDRHSTVPVMDVDPFAPASIAYTSGTTGRPKGVVHSQHNLVVVGGANRVWGGWRAVPRQGAVLPLTILNVMALCPLLVFQLDGTCVCVDRHDPHGIAQWVRAERIQSFSSVPTIVHDLVMSPEVVTEDLRTLSHIGAGGAGLPQSLADAYRRRFAKEVLAGYGLTEAPSVVTTQSPERPRPPGSAGQPLPHLSVTICDNEGEPMPTGEEGEICVAPVGRGPLAGVYTPFLGYWRDSEASSATLRDATLRTGDLGRVDADGVLFVTGRRDEVIVRGGAKVSPDEVEGVLRTDPRVVDAAVVGRPHQRLGEEVVAFVQLAPGARATKEELRQGCARHLARYKVPVRLHLVPDFERNAMGKIRKATLREPRGS